MGQKPKKKRKKTVSGRTAVLQWVLLGVSAAVFLFAAITLGKTLLTYKAAKDEYKALNDQFGPAAQTAKPAGNTQSPDGKDEATPQEPAAAVNFDALREINPDVVGWLAVDGTTISYPVVCGTDNSYYLNRSFERKGNASGCLFLDYRNEKDFTDDNSVIYGHNMNDGSMFHQLASFKKRAFWEESGGLIRLYTPDGVYQLQIFRVFITKDWQFNETRFNDEADYAAYLKKGASIELYDTGVDIDTRDRILTLSTCTYEYDDARLVVQAKFTQ
ncbi:MAG: class B sortase [Eubacteriales bacterium]|nr:class B sortase [Eubacteriales bacterium]